MYKNLSKPTLSRTRHNRPRRWHACWNYKHNDRISNIAPKQPTINNEYLVSGKKKKRISQKRSYEIIKN